MLDNNSRHAAHFTEPAALMPVAKAGEPTETLLRHHLSRNGLTLLSKVG
jgi:hypothetical protein